QRGQLMTRRKAANEAGDASRGNEPGGRSEPLNQAASHPDLSKAIFEGLMGHYKIPIAVIDQTGALYWMSPTARDLLRSPWPVRVAGGKLKFQDGCSGTEPMELLSTLDEGRKHLFISDEATGEWLLMGVWMQHFKGKRLYVLSFRPSRPLLTCKESGLAEEFKLTRSECEIVDRFANLQSPAEIAEDLGVTVATVRSHLKRTHAKMGVSSSRSLLQIIR